MLHYKMKSSYYMLVLVVNLYCSVFKSKTNKSAQVKETEKPSFKHICQVDVCLIQ